MSETDDGLAPVLAELATVLTKVAARLAAPAPHENGEGDHLLVIEEAAARLAVTKEWLRRRPDLPFVVRLSDAVVRYSARGVERYIAARTGR